VTLNCLNRYKLNITQRQHCCMKIVKEFLIEVKSLIDDKLN
jgi:hypothetical protein